MKANFFILTMVTMLVACAQSNINSEIISPVVLDEDVTDRLNEVFNGNNAKLRLFGNQNISSSIDKPVYIIQSERDLESICPNNIDFPKIDFSKCCIIYSSIQTSSISDELLATSLYFSKERNMFYFNVSIQKCVDCWTSIGYLYPYGVYSLSPLSISNIELIIDSKEK